MIGSRIGTGVSSGMPTRSPSAPPLTATVSTPKAAALASRFMTTALSGTTTERNTIISSRNETRSTPPMKSGSRSATPRVMSTFDRGRPADVDGEVGAGDGCRDGASSRSVSTRSSVASSWGEVVAISREHGGVAGVVDRGRRDRGDAVDLGELRRRPRRRR